MNYDSGKRCIAVLTGLSVLDRRCLMLSRIGVSLLAAALATISAPAFAASLPAIQVSASNQVPACVTPGRLRVFLKSRNPSLNARYDDIGVYYMRHGEELGIRWDIAFYQMVVETNSLRYTGDVDADQFNFAGLGATGGGVKGERFRSISDGVRAHLEHVLMYSGKHIDNPVAERTRKVQEWQVLLPFQRSIRGPITFTHLGRQWAPGDRGYSDDIKAISNIFNSAFCNRPDPRPEWVALARGNTKMAGSESSSKSKTVLAAAQTAEEKNIDKRSGLGAGSLIGISQSAQAANHKTAKTPEIINLDDEKAAAKSDQAADPIKSAMAAGQAKAAGAATTHELKPADSKCRVWTASYGGAKAIIIKAAGDGMTNFTVLDVHSGKEKREADAYIAAYAKGGETIGEFSSPSAALDKAFELCPEK
jgi:hypothetical protein